MASRDFTYHVAAQGYERRAARAGWPPLTHMRFLELASKAASLKQRLTAQYPDRADAFKVVPGDCNTTIALALDELADLNWAPTFAFLNQQSTEVRWTTIEALARYKRPDKWKTEIWILCANSLLPALAQGRHRRAVRRGNESHVRHRDLDRRADRQQGRAADPGRVPRRVLPRIEGKFSAGGSGVAGELLAVHKLDHHLLDFTASAPAVVPELTASETRAAIESGHPPNSIKLGDVWDALGANGFRVTTGATGKRNLVGPHGREIMLHAREILGWAIASEDLLAQLAAWDIRPVASGRYPVPPAVALTDYYRNYTAVRVGPYVRQGPA